MDVSSIASAASQLSAANTAATASNLVLRKALDLQEQTAATLLDAIPRPAYSNPSHLGGLVDLHA